MIIKSPSVHYTTKIFNALNLIKMAPAVDVGSVERRQLRALSGTNRTWCIVGIEPKRVANVRNVG